MVWFLRVEGSLMVLSSLHLRCILEHVCLVMETVAVVAEAAVTVGRFCMHFLDSTHDCRCILYRWLKAP